MIDFERARKAMVDNQLRTSGITDRRLLAAMGEVPREAFVPEARRTLAYIDEAHPLQEGRSGRALPSPAPFAKLVQLASIQHGDVVLDVACATGYSAAVLARLAAQVVAVESDSLMIEMARGALAGLDNVTLIEGPLEAGAPKLGPYDVVLVEGAVAAVPETLFSQLKEGGRLVVLIRSGVTAVANLFVRSGGEVASRAEFDASLPPLAAERPPEEFVF